MVPQIDKTLASEQKRADFQPKGDTAVELDRPTAACVLVTALLRAASKVAAQNLHAANLASFLAEARSPRCCSTARRPCC